MKSSDQPECLTCGGAGTVDGRIYYTFGDEQYPNPCVPCPCCKGSGRAVDHLGHRPIAALSHRERLAELRTLHNQSKVYFLIGQLARLTEWTGSDEQLAEWFWRMTRPEGAAAHTKAFPCQRQVLARLLALMEAILDDMTVLEPDPGPAQKRASH